MEQGIKLEGNPSQDIMAVLIAVADKVLANNRLVNRRRARKVLWNDNFENCKKSCKIHFNFNASFDLRMAQYYVEPPTSKRLGEHDQKPTLPYVRQWRYVCSQGLKARRKRALSVDLFGRLRLRCLYRPRSKFN